MVKHTHVYEAKNHVKKCSNIILLATPMRNRGDHLWTKKLLRVNARWKFPILITAKSNGIFIDVTAWKFVRILCSGGSPNAEEVLRIHDTSP